MFVSGLLTGLLGFLFLYTVIPSVITRLTGFGVFRRGTVKNQVALTFDDGPHPQYTPKLLDLLKRHNVKATFFVLGSRAELHPQLIMRMHREGHQIGIHNYNHTSNWLLPPWKVRRDHVERTAAIIEAIVGERPDHYRPPWGLVNGFDLLRRSEYRTVLWSLRTGDWNSRVCRDKLRHILVNEVTDGSVVLLHDSGDTLGADRLAPLYMMGALDEALRQLRDRDLQFVRLDEMA